MAKKKKARSSLKKIESKKKSDKKKLSTAKKRAPVKGISSKLEEVKEIALSLAASNREAEPSIKKVYWVPSVSEIRLIEIDETAFPTFGGKLEPCFFAPDPEMGLPLKMAIALIRSDEFGSLDLPDGWGKWEQMEDLGVG